MRKITRAVVPGQCLAELDDGLIVRCARPEDTEPLAQFQSWIHFGRERPAPDYGVMTRDLMSGQLPGFAIEDWTVVEDAGSGELVSALFLLSQTWSFAGIPIPTSRIELVATHPEYRRRGLVRRQMQIVHDWSRQRGDLLLAISGIPWYYRQFGYEMALDMDGGRGAPAEALPRLGNGESEPFRLRPAVQADVPLLDRLYAAGMRRYLVSCVRIPALWNYDLTERTRGSASYHLARIIEDTDGHPIGIMDCAESGAANVYELEEGYRFETVNPVVLRYLLEVGASATKADTPAVALMLGTEHPAYAASAELLSIDIPPYAWYLRVPDLVSFLRTIVSILDERLAASVLGPDGTLPQEGTFRMNFVYGGLQLTFDNGRMAKVEEWMPPQQDNRLVPRIRDALFPGLTFLQLLFGFRSVTELEHAFPDCIISSAEARALLGVLFPVRTSFVWPAG